MNSQNNPLALPVIKEEYDDVMVTVLEGWSPLDGNTSTNPSLPLVPTTSQSVSNLFSPTATKANESTACSTVPLPNLTKTHSSVASVQQRRVEKLNDSTACSTVPLLNPIKAHKRAPFVHNRQKFDVQRHKERLESTNILDHPSIHPGQSIRNEIPHVPSGTKAQSNISTPLFNIHSKLKQTQKQLKELTNNLIECRNENEMLKKDNKKLQLKYFEFETNANFKLDTLHKENSMLKYEINQLKEHQLRNEQSTVISTSANQSNEANMNDVMISVNKLFNENENNSDHVLEDAEEMSNMTTDNNDHSVVESFETSVNARQKSIQNASNLQTGSILHNLTKRKRSQPNRFVKRSKNIIENQQDFESIDRLLEPSNDQEQTLSSEEIHSSSQSGGNQIAPLSLESSSSTVQLINEIEQPKTGKCAKKYKCSDCGDVYTSRSSLNTHRGQIHNVEPHNFKCTWSQCDKEFGSNYSLTAHMQIHTGEQSRKCTECGKMFTRNFNLRQHMLVHSDARPFKCTWENCQKAFNDNSNLTRHLRIHLGERPFKCEWENCQMAFNDNSNLARHLRIHTGERPFKCEWENCQMAFNVSSHLVIHLRKHTGERPFKCDRANCTKAFSQSSGLTRHLVAHK